MKKNVLENSLLDFINDKNTKEAKNIINDNNVNLSYKYNLIFQTVCEKGNTELFDLLFDNPKVNIKDMGNIAFEFSTTNNNQYIVEKLIQFLDLDYFHWFNGLKKSYHNDIGMLSFIFYHKAFVNFREEMNKKNIKSYNTIIKKITESNISNF